MQHAEHPLRLTHTLMPTVLKVAGALCRKSPLLPPVTAQGGHRGLQPVRGGGRRGDGFPTASRILGNNLIAWRSLRPVPGEEAPPQARERHRHHRHRVRSRICTMPPRNAFSSPSRVSWPSGKMPTSSPRASAARDRVEGAAPAAPGPPRAGAIGIACAVRKRKLSTGMLEDAVVHDEADRARGTPRRSPARRRSSRGCRRGSPAPSSGMCSRPALSQR